MTGATRAQLIAVRQKLIESELRLQEATKIINYLMTWEEKPKQCEVAPNIDPVEEACLE